MLLKNLSFVLLFGSLIAGCAEKDSGSEQNAGLKKKPLPKQRTVRGVLNHFPSGVRSAQAWYGHNFMVDETPVIPTEEVPEGTLMKFVGATVAVTGVWHPGEQWNPTEDEMFMQTPVDPDIGVVVRGDGLKASSVSLVKK